MSNQDNRVLSRMGARELSAEELNCVNGGLRRHTCTFDPKIHVLDGECV
ncbi:MAG TPA: hypothetical protein VHA33_21585 [Candidatus Angelobacter sp.]|jgi:hypothetical protein|nr:hypothetical protein [Candidatus Angelobacter sp.]